MTDEQRKQLEELLAENQREQQAKSEELRKQLASQPLPYRWGYWCGVNCIFIILLHLFEAFAVPGRAQAQMIKEYGAVPGAGDPHFAGFIGFMLGSWMEMALIVGLASLGAFGIFRKKRYGVQAMFAAVAVIYADNLYCWFAGIQQPTPLLITGPIWCWCTYVYFKKRWQELS